jgi:pilus assembly protein CpaB
MNRKKLLVALVVAGITGLAASMLTFNYLKRPLPAVAAEQTPTGTVVVAAAQIPLGTFLTEGHVKTVAWTTGTLPDGYFAKRAVSVKVDEVVGVAGFVLPGTRVDVLVTLNPETEGDSQKPATTRLILQNVKVLASGQKIEKDAEGKPQTVTVITLLVTPEESEKLTLASTEGKIQMALRNAMDMDSVSTEGIQAAELVSEPSRPAPAANAPRRVVAPRPSTQVEVILGDKKTKETF